MLRSKSKRFKSRVYLFQLLPLSKKLYSINLHVGSSQFASFLHQRQLSLQRRGGGPILRRQVRLFGSGGLPMFGNFHPSTNGCFNRSSCQTSSVLSHSHFFPRQETLLDRTSISAHPTKWVGGYCSYSTSPICESCNSLRCPGTYSLISTSRNLCSGANFMYLESGGRYKRLPCYNYHSAVGGGDNSDGEERGETDADLDGDGSGEERDNEGDDRAESSADQKEVDRVYRVINELFALDRNMEAVLDECGINLTHDLVVDVLERFKHARKPATRFFFWAERKPGYSHDSRTYNTIMKILGKTRQFETMVSILEEMGKRGLLNMETFTIAIRAFAAAKERKKAVGVFELMKKYKFKTGIETVNCLLDCMGREKLGKEAQLLSEKLKDRFTPNLQTYTILLSGWCRVKNLLEAGRVWNEMVDKGLKPDIVAHNIMIDGLLKVHKRSDAVQLFEVMRVRGPTPNVLTYTLLIRDLCKQGKMVESIAYFNELVSKGCSPDPAVYTCLITGFGNQKKMDEVYGLLREMKEKGCPPDGRTYNALIKLLTSQRMPDDAIRVYRSMIGSGIEPTIHTFNMMMKSCFLVGKYEVARGVWDEMSRRGFCPDENSYTVLIGGLVREGRSDEACKYVEEMMNKGMRVPHIDFGKFVSNFGKVGRANILEELAERMRDSGKIEVSEVFVRWAKVLRRSREPGRFH